MEKTWWDNTQSLLLFCFINTLIYIFIFVIYKAKNPEKIKTFFVGYTGNVILTGLFIYFLVTGTSIFDDDFLYLLGVVASWYVLTIFLGIYGLIKANWFKFEPNPTVKEKRKYQGPGLY